MRIVLALFLLSGTAHAFPENIRHGYPSCSACHVNESGGGPLKPYGRGTSEALSTFGKEGLGDPLYGAVPPLPDWVYLGGDQRAVGVATRTDRQVIPMQADLELGVKPVPGITVDASVGSYGLDHSVEYRRAWAKADLSVAGQHSLTLRAGRFLPAYGVNVEDHTTLTRELLGLGEGAESYNAELAWMAPGGEVIGDLIYGDHTTVVARPDGSYDTTQGDEMTGASWRGAAYIGDRAQVGVSYLGVSNFEQWRQSYGAFAQVGVTERGYVLAELDRKFENGKSSNLSMVKVGYELYQGVLVTAQGDAADTVREGRLGLQWLPLPHWELLLEGRRSYSGLPLREYVDSGVLLVHHYL